MAKSIDKKDISKNLISTWLKRVNSNNKSKKQKEDEEDNEDKKDDFKCVDQLTSDEDSYDETKALENIKKLTKDTKSFNLVEKTSSASSASSTSKKTSTSVATSGVQASQNLAKKWSKKASTKKKGPIVVEANQEKLKEFNEKQADKKFQKLMEQNEKNLDKINEFIAKKSQLLRTSNTSSSLDSTASAFQNEIILDSGVPEKHSEEEEEEEDERETFLKTFETRRRKPPSLPPPQPKKRPSDSRLTSVTASSAVEGSEDLYILEETIDEQAKIIKKINQFIKMKCKFDGITDDISKSEFFLELNDLKEIKEKDYQTEISILNVEKLRFLTESQLEYIVLREIEYFIKIYAGQEPSWRHGEFKKNTRISKEALYGNAAFLNFDQSQFSTITNLFKQLFNMRRTLKFEITEYIVQVLLPESLIKICIFLYDCDKENAEIYLKNVRNN